MLPPKHTHFLARLSLKTTETATQKAILYFSKHGAYPTVVSFARVFC
jgi:hypothetical protein